MSGRKSKLPEHLEVQRTRVVCHKDAPVHNTSVQHWGAYMADGMDNSLVMDDFMKNLKIEVKSMNKDDMVFDMIGIDAAIANAFRRILIAEVATIAIEKVYVANNTSVIQDEVLAHRLGLVPLRVNPQLFDYRAEDAGDTPTEHNTIVLKMKVRCTRQGERMKNSTVKSDSLVWLPEGSEYSLGGQGVKITSFTGHQGEILGISEDDPIRPTYDDIILAKLRPGQEIELEAHAVKGVGKTHAKWSPVATAAYKMCPEVVLLEDLEDDMADKLVKKCPAKVFDIEDIGHVRKATVARPRDCTLCRECVREDGWEKKVQVRRIKDHFIFSIESTGAYSPSQLFLEAVQILVDKCDRILAELP